MADKVAWKVEQRYRAVLEVLDGSPVSEVAARHGVSRQTVYTWRARYSEHGIAGLQEGSRRPHRSPSRLDPELEALICELRRQHRRWGARRIRHELSRRAVEPVPSRATVHRVLLRNGLINVQEQAHPRRYRRWQREAPMQLWQLDLVSGVYLADGRECKLVTGIDDHSRYVVIAAVVAVPTGRAVCQAFCSAMRRYGVPGEVLTDNGKQFTGRFTRPFPAEVMFERICRENGISQRLTKRRSPTTTGKIERFHKTLREELLDLVKPFESLDAAQDAIDAWVHTYNHDRPHQSLEMATPASVFRPSTPKPVAVPTESWRGPEPEPELALEPSTLIEPAPVPPGAGAVEWDVRIPPSGHFPIARAQELWIGPAYAGRTVTLWADDRSVHVLLDGHHIKTVASRLNEEHLRYLRMRGARTAGPEPAGPALPRNGNGRHRLPENTPIEIDRTVTRDGTIDLNKQTWFVHPDLVGQRITLRLDGHLMHAIAGGTLVKTWPYPLTLNKRLALRGARSAAIPLPPAPPSQAPRAQRRVPRDGVVMVARQRLRVGTSHAGKIVTIIAEDTCFRILDGEQELAIHPRTTKRPLTRVKAEIRRRPRTTSPASPDDKTSTMS